jgi:hypothetical protein
MRSFDRQRWWLAAMVGGALLGVLYTLSPLTVVVACGAIALTAVSGRGLPDEERRWLIAILTVAFALRVVVVAALFLVSPHNSQGAGILFGDESYALYRSWRIRDVLLGIPILKYDYLIAYDNYGRSNFLSAITSVQTLFGPAPYALRLLNALIFVGAAVLLFRVARRAFGSLVAFSGLVVLLFLPTLFFWSISLLKESLYFVLTVIVLAAALGCMRSRSLPVTLATAACGGGALWALQGLRTGAVTIAVAGLALGFAARFAVEKTWRVWATALLLVVAAVLFLRRPAVQDRVLTGIAAAATEHAGHVFTVGHAYKLLDDTAYIFPRTKPEFSLTPAEAGRFVLRAVGAYLVTPLPWQLATKGELAYLPEQILWYALIALAPLGVYAGYRRDAVVTCLLAGYLVPTALAVALTTGNVGTLIRHRTLIVPYLVWLSAIGAWAAISRIAGQEWAR